MYGCEQGGGQVLHAAAGASRGGAAAARFSVRRGYDSDDMTSNVTPPLTDNHTADPMPANPQQIPKNAGIKSKKIQKNLRQRVCVDVVRGLIHHD